MCTLLTLLQELLHTCRCMHLNDSFLSSRIGDHLPDRLAIHLPSSLTMKGVYERMSEEMASNTCSVISRPQFYNLWKEYFPHITIPTVRNRLIDSNTDGNFVKPCVYNKINVPLCSILSPYLYCSIGEPVCQVRHLLCSQG